MIVFLNRELLLTRKQLRKVYGRHHAMWTITEYLSNHSHQYVSSVILTISSFPYSWFVIGLFKSYMAGTAYLSVAPEFTLFFVGFEWLTLKCPVNNFIDHCLSFFLWPLVSSNLFIAVISPSTGKMVLVLASNTKDKRIVLFVNVWTFKNRERKKG